MKTLKDLYIYANKENIKIRNYNFESDTSWKGQCIYDNYNNCMIFLNDKIKKSELKCTLAHEIGHFKKGIIQNNILSSRYRDMLIRSINDFRATKWAVLQLIPFKTFKSYLGTNKSKFDIANELEVTEDLVEFAYRLYEPLIYNSN